MENFITTITCHLPGVLINREAPKSQRKGFFHDITVRYKSDFCGHPSKANSLQYMEPLECPVNAAVEALDDVGWTAILHSKRVKPQSRQTKQQKQPRVDKINRTRITETILGVIGASVALPTQTIDPFGLKGPIQVGVHNNIHPVKPVVKIDAFKSYSSVLSQETLFGHSKSASLQSILLKPTFIASNIGLSEDFCKDVSDIDVGLNVLMGKVKNESPHATLYLLNCLHKYTKQLLMVSLRLTCRL